MLCRCINGKVGNLKCRPFGLLQPQEEQFAVNVITLNSGETGTGCHGVRADGLPVSSMTLT